MGRVYMSMACFLLLSLVGGTAYCNFKFMSDQQAGFGNLKEEHKILFWITLIVESFTFLGALIFYSLATCALFSWLSSMSPSKARRVTYQEAVC